MKLNRKKISMKEEQKIITNMITSTEFLKQTKGVINAYLFKSIYARNVATWCIEYFEHTNSAPGKDIQDIYVRRRKELEDEEEVELVSEFLQNLSDEWAESQLNNTVYEVQNTKKYMKLRQLEQLREQLDTAITEGNPDQGEFSVSNFKGVKETQSTGVNLFEDTERIKDAFDDTTEVLFSYPGDLGKAIGNMSRGEFVAILGGPKSGKSFALWYTAHRAALLGLSVMILNFEMSEAQYVRRSWQSLQGKPRYTKKVKLPYFEEQDDGFSIGYREEKREGINTRDIKKQQKKYKKATRTGEIRIESFIEGESTFSDAVIRMENLEYYENFIADVVIWDYPDIMASEIKADLRHQIDDTWIKIRGYAQKKNNLNVAASQVGASAWGKDIKGKDAAENKKKAAHVTKMFAINSTDEEMEQGIVRIQSLYEREGKRCMQQVVVLQSLDIGRFYMDSKFRKKVVDED